MGPDADNRYTPGGADDGYTANESRNRYTASDVRDGGGSTADRGFDLPETLESLPIRGGLILGFGAFLTSYVLTYAVTASMYATYGLGARELVVRRSPLGIEGDPPGTATTAAWSLLTNFGVGLERATEGGESEVVGLVEVLDYFGRVYVTTSVIVLVTLGILVGAGYLIANYADADADEPLTAAASSLLLVPAYLVCSGLVSVLAVWNPEGAEAVVVSPITSDALLYPGLLYPAFFGLLGGVLAVWPEAVDRIGDVIEQ